MRLVKLRTKIFAMTLGGLLLASCGHIPQPTQEELYARDRWAAMVTQEDRQMVFDEVGTHTSWSEKAKVLYELNRFQHLWHTEDRKSREATTKQEASTRAAATREQAARAARLSSRPTSRSGSHATTRHHAHSATQPDSEDE
jgi:hypothetical protein